MTQLQTFYLISAALFLAIAIIVAPTVWENHKKARK